MKSAVLSITAAAETSVFSMGEFVNNDQMWSQLLLKT